MISPQSTQYSLPPRNRWQWSQAHQTHRRDGTTTRQIREAPIGSIYIVSAFAEVSYVQLLAKYLERSDIRVYTHHILNRDFRGLNNISGITVDHYVRLTYEELVELCTICITPILPKSIMDMDEQLQQVILDFNKKAEL